MVKQIKLESPYVRVRTEEGASYGGNQAWFPHSWLRGAGCGIVAALDVMLYLKGETALEREAYVCRAAHLWKYELPVIPGFGINGLFLTLGMSRCFLREGLAYFASWSFFGKRTWRLAERMLAENIPVILAVGPNFPKIWKKERLTFYRKRTDGSFYAASSARAHFVTVTGREGQKWKISSWGKEYYIDLREYENYVRKSSSPLVCGIVRVHKLRK